jgi:cephalosporin hydroxylase
MTRSFLDSVRTAHRVLRDRGPVALLRSSANQLVPAARFRRLARSVRAKWPNATIEDVWAFLDDPANALLVVAMQDRQEFTGLLRLYTELRPTRVMEIGTAKGGTLFAFVTLAGPGARVISLDLPSRRFGGGGFMLDRRWGMYAEFAHPGQEVHLLRADSHAPESLTRVRQLLAGEPLDFLLIDGDHSYEGVKADFEMYGPLVRPGGAIAFHDIAGHTPEKVGGVPRFWQEVRAGRTTTEFVRDANQDGYGIGVIRP